MHAYEVSILQPKKSKAFYALQRPIPTFTLEANPCKVVLVSALITVCRRPDDDGIFYRLQRLLNLFLIETIRMG